MKKTMPTIRVSVSKTKEQWFVYPPREVLRECKKIPGFKFGFGVYNAHSPKARKRALEHIRQISIKVLEKYRK